MRRVLASLAVLVGLVTVGMVSAPATVAGASGGSTIYDSTQSPLPGNLVSLGYAATQAAEAGNQIAFSSGSGRVLTSVVVGLSSWGCQSGGWSTDDCVSAPGATFSEPVTLNLYNVGAGGTAVGTKIASFTNTFNIPYRPSADASYTTDCAADAATYSEPIADFDGHWYDAATGHCYNGLANNITFNLGHTQVPNKIIYGIAYNTSNYGAAPYGDSTACYTTAEGCPYDSLNLALTDDPTDVTVGSDPEQGTIYWNTETAANYCDDGAAGVGTFRIDSPGYPTCWTEGSGAPYYVPSVQFNAVTSAAPAITSRSSATEIKGHHFSFTVNTTGVPAPRLSELKTLPRGVTFTNNGNGTATLAGTPTQVKVSYLQFKATNSKGSALQNFGLIVKA